MLAGGYGFCKPELMRILVIGANGFVGRHVVASAIARHGVQAVVAGVRRPVDAAILPPSVEQRVMDATDRQSLMAALGGVTHIVNSVMGSDHAIVESARTTLAALEIGAVSRLVCLSSIAVYGDKSGVLYPADAPGKPTDGYGVAKIRAEQIIADGRASGFVFLRPGLVYGPGSALWTLRIARLLKAGRLGDMGANGEGVCNLVHVEDVADAVIAACDAPQADGEAYNLAMPSPPTWNAYLRDFSEALSLKPGRISPFRLRVERALAYPLKAAELAGGKLGIAVPEAITPGLARLLSHKVRYDSTATSLLLPQWKDYHEGVIQSALWAKQALA